LGQAFWNLTQTLTWLVWRQIDRVGRYTEIIDLAASYSNDVGVGEAPHMTLMDAMKDLIELIKQGKVSVRALDAASNWVEFSPLELTDANILDGRQGGFLKCGGKVRPRTYSELRFKNEEIRNTNSALHDFYNSGSPEIDAITAQLKGPQFVPKNNIKLRDAVAKVGLSKIENWSGQESIEANWYNQTGKVTADLLRWRDAVMWFQQELFAGNIVASRLEKNGIIVGLPKETFAQDDIEHIFREHQEQAWIIFVNAAELEMLLSNGMAKIRKPLKVTGKTKAPDLDNATNAIRAIDNLGSFRLDVKVEKIGNWCVEKGYKKPSKRTIQSAFSKLKINET
jgi:hypothetical protein